MFQRISCITRSMSKRCEDTAMGICSLPHITDSRRTTSLLDTIMVGSKLSKESCILSTTAPGQRSSLLSSSPLLPTKTLTLKSFWGTRPSTSKGNKLKMFGNTTILKDLLDQEYQLTRTFWSIWGMSRSCFSYSIFQSWSSTGVTDSSIRQAC